MRVANVCYAQDCELDRPAEVLLLLIFGSSLSQERESTATALAMIMDHRWLQHAMQLAKPGQPAELSVTSFAGSNACAMSQHHQCLPAMLSCSHHMHAACGFMSLPYLQTSMAWSTFTGVNGHKQHYFSAGQTKPCIQQQNMEQYSQKCAGVFCAICSMFCCCMCWACSLVIATSSTRSIATSCLPIFSYTS